MGVTVTVPQSEANSEDRDTLELLLAEVPGLSRLECTHRFSGGYSGSRVYLAQPTFGVTAAPNPWIIKLGTAAETQAEDAALVLAKSFVQSNLLASKLHVKIDGEHGVLVLDYAAYQGRTPVDLEFTMRRPESEEAVRSVVAALAAWSNSPQWHLRNLPRSLKDWCVPKLEGLPPRIRETMGLPTVYSPDFGEAYANPAYHLTRDLPRVEVLSPIGFAHGDLNLRNVLFAREDGHAVVTAKPVFIDFRHARQDGYSLTDLAKLEACIRYQQMPLIETSDNLSQMGAALLRQRETIEISIT